MAGTENRTQKKIFPTETELSEIVRRKTDCAFERIRQEESGLMQMTEKRAEQAVSETTGKRTWNAGERMENTGGRRFRVPAAAIVGVCILAASSISAAAALRYYWGRGMNEALRASEEQQRELVEQGIAKVYEKQQADETPRGGEENAKETAAASPAVICDGVTIAPDTVIADERFAYLTFRISGFHAEAWETVWPHLKEVYLAGDPDTEKNQVNMSGHIYNGITADGNGNLVYEDGSPVEYDEEGRTLNHYTDENGDLTFVMRICVGNKGGSLLGRTLHVGFQDVAALTYAVDASGFRKPSIESWVSGKWEFDITLPDVSAVKHIAVGKPIEGTAFTVESIDLSPISVQANYEVDGAPETKRFENGVPRVTGLILQDGTRLPEMAESGGNGYTDSAKTRAHDMAGFYRVIDVDEVAGLIVSVWDGGNEYRTADVMLR